MQNRQQAARVLGAAGVAPFVALLVVVALGGPAWIIDLLRGYALLILAFLCGSLWADALNRPADGPAPLILSNLIVLAALVALLLPLGWAFAWLAALFALHALTEWRWTRAGQPGWYRRLRWMLSIAVTVLLAATAAVAARGG
ncbi:DUF3429 domain-containing protein [Wenzhouxiangella sp. XN79A]|uniref:DUF3429 domain-containing protein n=1 Tax=Wenzhouxiangella sp. XN79A TaxID=2724193 RepID=UPI00144AC786|nr:DUF3429 family protein [Wenzhouxiangella sp. XN79A]NKI35686.1 DUF3429 domain-containing protein [Wenzhouxiangella sp. XN79A]